MFVVENLTDTKKHKGKKPLILPTTMNILLHIFLVSFLSRIQNVTIPYILLNNQFFV